MQTKSFLKSDINIINIIGVIIAIIAYLGEQNWIPSTIVGLIIFTWSVFLKKFKSFKPIIITGVKGGWMMYAVNILSGLVLIAQYLLDHKLFDIPTSLLTMFIFIVNIVIRTFFTNQPEPAS